mmetsp:Transcript_84255/g.225210  ORF Transcript_84255/g.225210 Transcript_84255/m.225210 type:complete len:83 (-) Transcript_84255:18-266(-)
MEATRRPKARFGHFVHPRVHTRRHDRAPQSMARACTIRELGGAASHPALRWLPFQGALSTAMSVAGQRLLRWATPACRRTAS